jgi:hypothetical protein
VSFRGATRVAVQRMPRQEKAELERRVQDLERQHPEWSARLIEHELEGVAPVAFGDWKDATPNRLARIRQVQRWRRGARGKLGSDVAQPLFPFLWPMGELQRQGMEPGFTARSTVAQGTHRLFLFNCSVEPVRDVRVKIGGRELSYDPVILPGKFAEVHWLRSDAVRQSALEATAGRSVRHRMLVDFVVAKGTRRARLEGDLTLDPSQGWVSFTSRDGRQKELE